ncbi:chemotaxis protein CheB [Sporomusa malonica]|uniref:protein-glutamate O-methyltransferase n=1 Tax=Sporomusa malonica TaxID=112901 RepID=A0A1W2DLA5_9FIRM|nr:chemotaxis protein CheB [Sporomusa malonica]SMC97808.1 two-component system, chemotaxis family, CheB/CheR fusion protein [Sporomusa malonica]
MEKNNSGSEWQDCPIVGVGASAGGLQALLQMFESVPEVTGMAFVVIQHLDAKNESTLASNLANVTSMAVSEAEDGTVARPNHVYVIAPGSELTIAHGVLTVGPQNNGVRRYTPIDTFLESLAEYKGSKAIGVILSGNGADGSRGLKEIKAAGGFTFAQEPQSAGYEGMPLSAIATGMVDFVLTPPEIAGEISRISRSRIIASSITGARELFPDGAGVLDGIIGLLRKACGINFAEYKQLTVKRRILRRMVLHKLDKLEDYAAYLRQNGAELAALQQDMLINVTNFFRDPQAFGTLKTTAFPLIVSNTTSSTPIRLWVPGCATGEEAYSLAIALLEFLEDNALNRPIQIFATDINETVIEKARAGIYPKSIMTDVSLARLSRFFVEVEQGWQVSKTIRDICVFARQDMGQDPPISRVDLISCRNVMIYFGPALHKRMFPMFHYALNPGGFLILGASESIGVFADLFDLVDKKYRIYTKKAVATPLMSDFAIAEHAASAQNNDKDDQGSPNGGSWLDIQKEADRIVVNKYAPPGVIINSKLDIIQYRGRTGVYLEPAPGMPSVNLLKMARDGLFLALRAAVNQARKENVLVRKEGLHVMKNGHSLPVNVDVVPINGPFQKGEYFLVLFRDAVSHHLTESNPDSGALARQDFYKAEDPGEILGLKQEIAATKEYLQSIIDQHEAANEDIRYANEEVQSSNEELQSMNEELETAKEELQSTNEELMTLNEELRTRNVELSQVNDDMLNLLRSISIPVLILSSDLRIRRFNSIAEKAFNLISTDVGRPINNIKPNIDIPDLEQASLEVIDTLNSKEQEVQDRWGHWYSMQIRPYKTVDNKINGVIISFADINTVKKSFAVVQEAREYAEAIVETVRHPLIVLDADLRLKTANKAFYQTFRLTPEEMTGQSILPMKGGQWDIPELHTLLTDILEHDTTFEGFAISCDFPDIGKQTMLINARRIVDAHNKTKRILLAFETIAPQIGKPQ